MTEVSIRPVERRDFDRLIALLGQLGYELSVAELEDRTAQVWGSANQYFVVATDPDDHVVGFLHAYGRPSIEKPPEVTIQAMAVDERQRARGIGKVLLASLVPWAKAAGFANIGLHTQTKRTQAQAFYEAQGFARIAESFLYGRRLAD